jgi:2'-5' RNA ligase
MNCGPDGSDPINSFAVVTYIRGPLADFLNGLRSELVLGCDSHAHVTILPPRPLNTDVASATEFISAHVGQFRAFPIQVTRIRVFPITHVIYADIGEGTAELEQMHRVLNRDGLFFEEPFEYHPHLTLAQGLMPEDVPDLIQLAERRWDEWSHGRTFTVNMLTFVQNTVENKWLDLADWTLPRPAEVYSR